MRPQRTWRARPAEAVNRNPGARRGQDSAARKLAPLVLLMLFPACASKEEPIKTDTVRAHASREDRAAIESARLEMLREEERPGDPDDPSPVPVMFVNGEALTVEDVLKWVRPALNEMRAELSPEEYQAKMLELLRAEVRAQAERTVISQEAQKRMGAPVVERLDAFVDGRIRDIVNQEHGGRESRYREWLQQRGITLEEDRERIRREMLVVAYLQRTIGPKVAEPTRRELQRFHEEYTASTLEKRKRKMSLIDIPYGDRDATGRKVTAPVPLEDARRRADRALAKIRAGEDFAAVARDYSEGVNAPSGGDWGWMTRDGVKPRWKPAVEELYKLEPGQTSSVIQTDETLFIVRCAEIEPVELPSFEAMQPRLVESFKQQQFEVLTRELVRELFDAAEVRPRNPGRFLLAVVEAAQRDVVGPAR